jgi:outer membrane immunogenic protein
MFRKYGIWVLVPAVVSIGLPASSQEGGLANRNEVTVQGFGGFVKSNSDKGVDQSATNTGGVLASYRFFFNNYSGVEANYGYSSGTQNFGLPGGKFGLDSRSHEISAAYVFRYPLRRLTPFVLAGAGGLIFDPKDFRGVSTQSRAAFVYGGGADFRVTKHFFARAEYRGFVYNSPTYDLPGLAGTDRITHRAEPSLGFGYRF